MDENTDTIVSYRSISYVIILTLAIQFATLFLTSRFIIHYEVLPSFEPAGGGIAGSIINSLILVSTSILVTLMMIILIRNGKEYILKIILASVMCLGTLFTTFTITALAMTGILYSIPIAIITSISITSIAVISLVRPSAGRLPIIASTTLAIYYGTSLAIFMKPPTVLILPLAFGLYDIYAVFRGPLRVLINETSEKVQFYPMIVRLGEVHIGLGDLVFYSMLPAVGLLLLNIRIAILLVGVVQVGLLSTLYFLKQFKFFPGLPIPIFLGTAILTLALYL